MNDPSCPQALLEMQRWFASVITAPIQESDQADLPIYQSCLIDEMRERIVPSPQLKSEERIGIYHQQYWWRLITVIQELYPSLVRIFDYEDVNLLIAEPYLLHCPPKDWFLSRIGSKLPQWIEKNYREKDSPLVHRLACLDHAYESLIFADLLPQLEPNAIPQCERKTLYLQPCVTLFELEADLFTFRTQLLEYPPSHWQTHDLPKIKKSLKKTFFVFFRKNEKDFYEEISESQFQLLSRFQKGAKLTDLIPLLSNCSDIAESLQNISSRGWLTIFKNSLALRLKGHSGIL